MGRTSNVGFCLHSHASFESCRIPLSHNRRTTIRTQSSRYVARYVAHHDRHRLWEMRAQAAMKTPCRTHAEPVHLPGRVVDGRHCHSWGRCTMDSSQDTESALGSSSPITAPRTGPQASLAPRLAPTHPPRAKMEMRTFAIPPQTWSQLGFQLLRKAVVYFHQPSTHGETVAATSSIAPPASVSPPRPHTPTEPADSEDFAV